MNILVKFAKNTYMTIGLFMLGALSILVFFGVVGGVLKKLSIPEWLAFCIILAFTLGVVLAPLQFAGASISISGFGIPLVLVGIMCARIGFSKEIFGALWGSLLVASICVAFYLWYPMQLEQTYLYSVLLGLTVGIVSAIATRGHKAALLGCVAGVLLFELCVGVYDRVYNIDTVYLGSMLTLDVILISSTVCILVLQTVGGLQSHTTASTQTAVPMSRSFNNHVALNTESAADNNMEMIDYYRQQGDYSKIYPEDFVTTQSPDKTQESTIEQSTIQALDITKAKTDTSIQQDNDNKNKFIGYFGES
ncbi:MAG: hypothetical protein LBK70_01445 [Clostridiales bacterium]|jgi:hypothetical protein|nr:hypothetical protein [Clostridiales bacterium]